MENEKQLSLLLESPLDVEPPLPEAHRTAIAVAVSTEGAMLAVADRPGGANVVMFPGRSHASRQEKNISDLLQRILMRSKFFE